MKLKRHILTALLLTGLAAGTLSVRADNTNTPTSSATKEAKVVPYPLTKCVVSDEKLGGDMGKPVTLIYKGQEMKFCCKDCVKDFNKDPEKWMKKFDEAKAKAAAGKK